MQVKRDLDGLGQDDASKRQRTTAGPSKVLHIRALPMGTTEAELAALCSPFGSVVKVLLLNAKQQAFVQMASLEAAQNVLLQFSQGATLRGKQVHLQYSSRQEVAVSGSSTTSLMGGIGYGGGGLGGDAPPNYILLVSIINARVPVTLDNIHEVFKTYGEVKKIITFVKDGVFKALVQMGATDYAINAKHNLEGKDMFQGCCTLRIGFSKLTELNVKENGPKQRDFTRPYGAGMSGAAMLGFSQPAQPQYMMQQGGMGYGMDGMGQAANVQGMMGMPGGLDQYGALGGGQGMGGGEQATGGPGCVLLVNQLPSGFTADNVFILFGVYGDVMRVKILYNKRETAMVQFATPAQAQLARMHLNGFALSDSELKISTSKHVDVQLPRNAESDPETAELTKDYSKSPIHRFRGRGSRNMKNIHPPSAVLHVSNIPEGSTKEEIRQLFTPESEAPGTVKVQFFKNDRKMAYVRLKDAQTGALMLIRMHNFKYKEKYVRVSFTGKEPSTVEDSAE
eukprot:gb/GEZN01006918.1/.p1 GENE.gb/GEZN01006918.1/~~gb/GEZN01006918.1/.p1  ORF type:complete len:509 (-),score=86.41 gb/GEZN01006918.1/:50-1576(-)